MLVVSCNAWLDVTPENAIADDDLFSTGFGYRNALNGIYTNLASDELLKALHTLEDKGFARQPFSTYYEVANTLNELKEKIN